MPARRWYEVDPASTLVLALVLSVLLLVVALTGLRRRIADLPDIGRAISREDLDASIAETKYLEAHTPDQTGPRETPETLP